ncbi:MAG: hypothetical protein ACXVLF_12195 [Flavisolibacter sp.]
MEELKLVPSEPVWEKVEMQIRKEKDRRRALLWIPLFALVGAGLWLGIDKYAQRTAFKSPPPVKENHVGLPASESHAPVESFKANPKATSGNHLTIPKAGIENRRFTPGDVKRSSAKAIESSVAISKVPKVSVPASKETAVAESTENNNKNDKTEVIQGKESIPSIQPKTTQPSDSSKAAKPTISATTQPVKTDSTAVKAGPVKKYAISRQWKFNLVVASGWSGLGKVEFSNGQKSMNVYSSPPSGTSNGGTGQYSYYGPSAVEKGFAFTAGARAKKQLTKRTSFATGLLYDYYSNTIQVGSQVNQNTTLLSYPVSRFYYSAYQYYSGQTTVLQPYKNKYHFVTVPAEMDWQILKKHPLNLSFGLSFQYLVATNALRYDYNTQAYFHNISAFNRAQLMSGISMTYSVPLRKKPLSFGPQFQYGLTRLEKGNADNHLFSYGLKAQWQFKN